MSIKKIFCGVVGFIAAEGVCLANSWYYLAVIIPIVFSLIALSQLVYGGKKEPRQILR